jgi:hypothetical protein
MHQPIRNVPLPGLAWPTFGAGCDRGVARRVTVERLYAFLASR